MRASCSASPQPRVKLLNIGTEELKGTDELRTPPRCCARPTICRSASTASPRATSCRAAKSTSSSPTAFPATSRSRPPKAPRASSPTCCAARSKARSAPRPASRCRSPALNLLKVHLDPNNHNGAVFLGLNGLVVKSHGSANPKGVANAIRVAASMVRNDITRKIGDDLDNFRAHAFANEAGAMTRRSVVAGRRQRAAQAAGHQRGAGRDRRHHRRVDRRAHRDPQPLHRRRWRDDRRASPPMPRARALDACRHRRERDRPHRPRHRDARPDLPVVGDQGPGGARHQRLRRVRRARRLHRLPLRAVGRRFDAPLGQCRARRW